MLFRGPLELYFLPVFIIIKVTVDYIGNQKGLPDLHCYI